MTTPEPEAREARNLTKHSLADIPSQRVPELRDRFWEFVDKGNPHQCWPWTGTATKGGYGGFRFDGITIRAPRLSWELAHGPFSKGLMIDHLCRNPKCVNPSHLEPVTNRENTLRGCSPLAINAKKRYCPYGHEYNEENTRERVADGWIRRDCRTCRNASNVDLRRRKRAQKEAHLLATGWSRAGDLPSGNRLIHLFQHPNHNPPSGYDAFPLRRAVKHQAIIDGGSGCDCRPVREGERD